MALPRRPPIFLFEKDEVCWSGGANVPLISRDIRHQALRAESGALRAESGALRFEIVGLDLCRVLLRGASWVKTLVDWS